MQRRHFLLYTAGLATATTTAGGAAAVRPCPPSTLNIAGGTSASAACAAPSQDGIVAIRLSSTTGGTNLPWTVGQVFKKGDIPAGLGIGASETAIQAVVKNRWPDGSAKFAILSGRTTLSANVARQVVLTAVSEPPASGALSERDLIDANPSVTAVVSNGNPATVNATVTLASLLGTAARVRQFVQGPQMYEAHYRSACGADPHLTLWFYVRFYAGGAIEIETALENGNLFVGGPGGRTYDFTLSVNGTTRVTHRSVSHAHHTRWSRVDWYGADPQILPTHDVDYLKATRLVPNYPSGTPSASAWSGSSNFDTLGAPASPANSGAPFALGNFRNLMAAGGDAASIGVLPAWEALYLVNGDARGYSATLQNARNWGRYPVYYRDESTVRGVVDRPVQPTQYPQLAFVNSNHGWHYGVGGGSTLLPAPQTDIPSSQRIDIGHCPATPYLAYLLSGRYMFMEATQFFVSAAVISQGTEMRGGAAAVIAAVRGTGPANRNGDVGRHWGWGIRNIAFAACITPDEDTVLQSEYRTILTNCISDRLAAVTTAPTANNLGILAFEDGESSGVGVFETNKPWMLSFMVASLGLAYDLEVNAGSTARSQHAALMQHGYKFNVGLWGTTGGYNYRRAGAYTIATMTGATGAYYGATWLPDWNAVYVASFGVGGLLTQGFPSLSFSDGLDLHDVTPTETTLNAQALFSSYAQQTAAPLAWAVDHNAPGAAAARLRYETSSTYIAAQSAIVDNPKWQMLPRRAG